VSRSFIRAGFAATLAIAMVLASATDTSASEGGRRVRITDQCDPATFNAAIGPGTCQGDGNITFDEFIAMLQENQKAGPWAFLPHVFNVVEGQSVVVDNVGGETHTFTRVANFGPGFVQPLNDLVFGPGAVPLPEFTPPFGPGINFVPSGGTLTLETGPGTQLDLGTNRIECGIHPWMQMLVNVRSAD
jgi:hypothetical protein